MAIQIDIVTALGWFVAAWQGVDHTLDHLIAKRFRLSLAETYCITSNLATRSKIEILQSHYNITMKNDDIMEILKRLKGYSDLRNDIMHGNFADSDQHPFQLIRIRAQEKLKQRRKKMDADHLMIVVNDILSLAIRLAEREEYHTTSCKGSPVYHNATRS